MTIVLLKLTPALGLLWQGQEAIEDLLDQLD
jgi:hypothetical protein